MQKDNLDNKIIQNFPGLIVRKDLASKLKGAYAIPTYVLEFLLDRYYSSPDEEVIEHDMKQVRELLEEHYIDPEKIEIIKSRIRELGIYKVLDRFKVRLILSEDTDWRELASLNLKHIHINDDFIYDNEQFLYRICGIVTLRYDSSLTRQGNVGPFFLQEFQPVHLSSNLAILDACV